MLIFAFDVFLILHINKHGTFYLACYRTDPSHLHTEGNINIHLTIYDIPLVEIWSLFWKYKIGICFQLEKNMQSPKRSIMTAFPPFLWGVMVVYISINILILLVWILFHFKEWLFYVFWCYLKKTFVQRLREKITRVISNGYPYKKQQSGLFLLGYLTQTFMESKLHIIFIAYSKLNTRRVYPLDWLLSVI